MIAVFSDASCYDVTVLQCYACSVKILDIVFSVPVLENALRFLELVLRFLGKVKDCLGVMNFYCNM